jgi:hypothetical protein
MSLAAKLILALALFVGGFAGGIKWHVGIVAERELAEQRARESDARQQRQFNDRKAGQHAGAVARLADQLGDAREKIARLSGRACLDAGTVSVLNATGVVDGAAAAGEPASAASAAAASASHGTGLRVSTDVDVAGYIALCRTRYAEVSDQLNQILDIEDRRHPPAGASP